MNVTLTADDVRLIREALWDRSSQVLGACDVAGIPWHDSPTMTAIDDLLDRLPEPVESITLGEA
jgi:hypothetical protein